MDKKYNWLAAFVLILVLALLGYGALTTKDTRSMTDKIDDALSSLSNGADKASRQMQSRTPGQKLGDAVKDAGDTIKDNTQPSDNK